MYFYILMGSVIVPMLYSIFVCDFIIHWKKFFLSTASIAVLFLIWDAFFTSWGVWGFNDDYCLGLYILRMPIEEWLFFFIIPFCSLFTHFAFFYAFPKLKLNKQLTQIISALIVLTAASLIIIYPTRAYTAVNYSFLLITLSLGILFNIRRLQQFYISFLIILVPFFIVNGLLTGVLSEAPVVWYDNQENLGIRLLTIPIEDIGYAFTMLFGNLVIFDWLKD
ncbi:lycopene cyclase domain-containing protein [Reichenbachiella sp.]|uniref:lycopene cyclase domain-containing protein n=1 Tax=Reichenbachiella sp. TaxID=2184521 RepID=UPI003BB0B96E